MSVLIRLISAAVFTLAALSAAAADLPPPTSQEFCVRVQQILANTDMVGTNEIFTDMPAYRASKPAPDPLLIYQVVTYQGQMPIAVSCKVKGAAHIRSAYGDEAAGQQRYCPVVAGMVRDQAVAALTEAGETEAAERAAAFVIEQNEPYMTGRDYLSDFPLSFVGDDGAIHINSPGLFHDYDSWTTWILPEDFEGQTYCHLATVDYMMALATGQMEPGTILTTVDEAPVTPQ